MKNATPGNGKCRLIEKAAWDGPPPPLLLHTSAPRDLVGVFMSGGARIVFIPGELRRSLERKFLAGGFRNGSLDLKS